MGHETQELIATFEQLPAAKRVEVADFAKFLLEREGDARWEAIVAEGKAGGKSGKLDAFLKASRQEGSRPLDLGEL